MPDHLLSAAFTAVFAAGILALGLFGADTAFAQNRPEKLVVGLLPGESAPTVMRLNEPMRAYLEKRLKIPVELVVGANYAATGEALRFGRLDVAYLGPVTYILQSRRTKLEPFARPTHAGVGPTFQAVVIVPKDSPAKALADLKGQEVAYGDPASTSGTWVPRYQLLEAGLVAGRDYTLRVLGAHDSVALAVANHKVAAGGLSMPVYERLLKEARSTATPSASWRNPRPFPNICGPSATVSTRPSRKKSAFKEEIRQAFVSVSDPEALKVFRAEAFIPTVDSDVDRVRTWIEAIRKESPDAVPAP